MTFSSFRYRRWQMYLNIFIPTFLRSAPFLTLRSNLSRIWTWRIIYNFCTILRRIICSSDSTVKRNTRSLYAVRSPSHDARYGFNSNGISRLICTTLVGPVLSTSIRKRERTICQRIVWKRMEERKAEKVGRVFTVEDRRSRYSPCLAEDCEAFRIPPEAGDPVCRAAAPWPTTQKRRGELTLKFCFPVERPRSRVSTGITIPLQWAMATPCRNRGSSKRKDTRKTRACVPTYNRDF